MDDDEADLIFSVGRFVLYNVDTVSKPLSSRQISPFCHDPSHPIPTHKEV